MKLLMRIYCKIVRHHKYSYFSDECVRCGKLKSSAWERLKNHQS